MLAFAPFLLAPRRLCLISKHPRSMCVHAKAKAKAKTRNQQTSNERKKMQRAYERGIKQISMIDMESE